jgi:MbtH protein
MASDQDTDIYTVVTHDVEGRYSIWLDYQPVPPGWRAVGKTGTKQECLDYIGEVWTDMRPLSLRQHMDAAKQQEQR